MGHIAEFIEYLLELYEASEEDNIKEHSTNVVKDLQDLQSEIQQHRETMTRLLKANSGKLNDRLEDVRRTLHREYNSTSKLMLAGKENKEHLKWLGGYLQGLALCIDVLEQNKTAKEEVE